MSQEIMALRGRLSVAKSRVRELSLEAKGLILSVRGALDPFEPDVTRLAVDQAHVSAGRLVEVVAELRDVREQVRELEAALG